MTDRFFSTYQIARLLGTSLDAVEKWMNDGSLLYNRMPDGTNRITESALIDFLTQKGIDLGEVLSKAGYTRVTAENPANLTPDDSGEQTPPDPPETHEPDDPENKEQPEPEPEPEPIQPRQDKSSDETADSAPAPQPGTAEVEPEPVESDDPPAISGEIDQPAEDGLRAAQICDAIFADAVKQNAQSIHLTALEDRVVLQLRIGGALKDKTNFDPRLTDSLRSEILEHLLELAGASDNPHKLTAPLTAVFTAAVDSREMAIRISAIPTVRGAKFVMHMPPAPIELKSLAPDETAISDLNELLQGDGLIVVASKRRIGRDSVIQASMSAGHAAGAGVLAIGPGYVRDAETICRLPVGPPSGPTYASASETIADQDADTVALAELRDPTTGWNAFQAAHDGSLVIAGTNAESAVGAINELRAMGVESWPLARTLKAVIEQVSLPALCEHCRTADGDSSFKPVGCDRCEETGWAGRVVLTGIVFVRDRLAELIRTEAPDDQLNREIADSNRWALANVAQRAVAAGVTTARQAARFLQ